MPFFNRLKPKPENREIASLSDEAIFTSENRSSNHTENDLMPGHLLAIQLGAFLEQIPKEITGKISDHPSRTVTIAKEDLFIDEEAHTASVPLSILSLSCPDIFSRPISIEEDRPITFSLDYRAPPPVVVVDDPPVENAVGPKFLLIAMKNIALIFPPDLETPEIRQLTDSDAEISLPFALLKPQLASGKIVIPAAQFGELVPADLKKHFDFIEPSAEIPIPLADVISQLPPQAIQRRDDQDNLPETVPILTPFSEHAREDAARFGFLETPERSPLLALPPINPTRLPPEEERLPADADSPELMNIERLQSLFMTDESLDLGGVIARIASLPGLKASILCDLGGRKIAGILRGLDQEVEVISVLPQLFQQVDHQISPLKIGALETLTLHCEGQQLSAFLQEEYSLIVLHENLPFKPGVREKIGMVLAEIGTRKAASDADY
jgi:hypothetical protein